jgi:hypothetical protein
MKQDYKNFILRKSPWSWVSSRERYLLFVWLISHNKNTIRWFNMRKKILLNDRQIQLIIKLKRTGWNQPTVLRLQVGPTQRHGKERRKANWVPYGRPTTGQGNPQQDLTPINSRRPSPRQSPVSSCHLDDTSPGCGSINALSL